MHGASRLAGNGASDVIVSGGIAGRSAASFKQNSNKRNWSAIHQNSLEKIKSISNKKSDITANEIKRSLCDTMLSSAGLIRNEVGLKKGQNKLKTLNDLLKNGVQAQNLSQAIHVFEAEHMLLTAKVIIDSALIRTESRGAHHRSDYPVIDDINWLHHIGFMMNADQQLTSKKVPIA